MSLAFLPHFSPLQRALVLGKLHLLVSFQAAHHRDPFPLWGVFDAKEEHKKDILVLLTPMITSLFLCILFNSSLMGAVLVAGVAAVAAWKSRED